MLGLGRRTIFLNLPMSPAIEGLIYLGTSDTYDKKNDQVYTTSNITPEDMVLFLSEFFTQVYVHRIVPAHTDQLEFEPWFQRMVDEFFHPSVEPVIISRYLVEFFKTHAMTIDVAMHRITKIDHRVIYYIQVFISDTHFALLIHTDKLLGWYDNDNHTQDHSSEGFSSSL